MENKSNLTPELKQIYDRVMETSTNTKPPLENPNPQEIVPNVNVNSSETNLVSSNIEKTPPPQVTASPQNAPSGQLAPQQSVPFVPQATTSPMASMAGTVQPIEHRKSKKTIFITLSILFIILWALFWAFFFGLVNI